MKPIRCLIIGAAEHDRDGERQTLFDLRDGKQSDGWARFLKLNYVHYGGDALMSHQLASIAYLSSTAPLEKSDGLFRYADVSLLSSWRTPLLGGMFVYQYLKARGFDVALVQHVQLQAEKLDAALREEPDVIAISTTLITSPTEMRALVRRCRRFSPSSFVVLGGMSVWNHYQAKLADLQQRAGGAQTNGEEAMSGFGFLGADALVVDPFGVETLAALLDRLRRAAALDDLANTVLFRDGAAQSTLRRRNEGSDAVKMRMNWDRIEDEHIGSIVNVRTQISCPFRCSFCSYPTTQGPVIKAEVDAFDAELRALARRGVRHLMLIDDTFNVPPKRFVEVMKVLRRYDFGWYAFIRCQFLRKEQVELMKESGCVGVYLGLESVDTATLERMNKMATPEEFLRGVDLLAARGILTYASFIIGFPGDTPDTVIKVRDFVEQSGLDYYNLKPFWYDHSTPISQRAVEFGLTGQGYNWKHATMNVGEAYDIIENLILETRGRYVGLHSGELWEIGQLGARGLGKAHIDAVFDAHNVMLREDLRGAADAAAKERAFSHLVSTLRDVSLTPAAW
jgi:p-methyltransferase